MDWNAHQKKPKSPQKSFEDFFNEFLNEPSAFIRVVVIAVIAAAAYSSWYTVKPQEKAVVTRFGRYVTTAPPGLHFKIPFGVERVQLVQTQELRQEAFGYYLDNDTTRTVTSPFARRGAGTISRRFGKRRNLDDESLMLTGDLNVANVEWVVQYRVADPQKYLFNVANPEKNVRDISQAATRQVVGDKLINDVLTIGRKAIEGEVRVLIQEILDSYDMGLTIEANPSIINKRI